VFDFFHALPQYTFLQVALAAGLLASISCGVVGSYVVTRRITYIAGAIAHSVLGGMGAAMYLQVVHGWTWLHPLHGAVVAALLAAAIIAWVTLRGRQREDTVIGAVWAIGMAIGVVFIYRTPGQVDLMSYFFGSILMLTTEDLWLLGITDVLVVGTSVLCYSRLLAVCYDEEFARLRGVNVELYYVLLLCLTALTVVLLVTTVGILLVIALLTLPVAIGSFVCRTLWSLMLLAMLLCAVFVVIGLAAAYSAELPPGATIILVAGAAYLAILPGSALHRRLRSRAI